MRGVQAVDWAALAPAAAPLVAMLAVLVVQAVAPARRLLLDVTALAGLLTGGLALALTGAQQRATFCVGGDGAVPGVCSYVTGPLTVSLQAVVLGAALVCLLLALDGPGARARAEHHALLLAATGGALVLAGARDLGTLAIAVETSSLPVVAMVALRRDAVGAQAALKLLLVSVVSFGLLMMGVALVYAGTGSVHLSSVVATTSVQAAADGGPARLLVALGAAFALSGLAYKLSAVPFGWWTPDVYAGAPVPVAAFLSTVSKIAGLAAVLVVLLVGLPTVTDGWSGLVAALAVASMTVGNLVALRQRSPVRLMAWSTVAQAGWVLLPLAGAGAGLVAAAEASVGYLLAYVAASLAVFAVVVLVTRHHVEGAAHLLEDYRGLARREPVAAAVLAFALLCLAGLPPGVMGLVAKVVALRPVVDDGLWWVAAAAAVNVALGLAYYLRWAALLVATPGDPSSQEPQEPQDRGGPVTGAVTWSVTAAEGVALGVAGGACLVLSVLPQLVAGPFGGS